MGSATGMIPCKSSIPRLSRDCFIDLMDIWRSERGGVDSASSAIPYKLSIPETIHIGGVVIESWRVDDSDELEQRRIEVKGASEEGER